MTEQRRKLRSEVQDRTHYIHYKPSDHHSELGLSQGSSSFDTQANSVVLDLDGDEKQILRKPKSSSMRW